MNETPQKKKPRFFRRLWPTSTAARAALVTALVLFITLLIVWLIRFLGPNSVAHRHAVTGTRMLIELMLVLVIPFVLYWGLRRWNQVIEGEFPDIDQAWQKGLKSLEAQGISVGDLPIFLILGSCRREVERALIEALESQVIVQGIPDEAGLSPALQWYATAESIYLFCPGVSSLSALLGRWTTPSNLGGERRPVPVRTAERAPVAVPQPLMAQPVDTPAAAQAKPPAAPGMEKPSPIPQVPERQKSEPLLGTLQVESVADKQTSRQPAGPASAAAPAFGKQPVQSSSPPKPHGTVGAPAQFFGTLNTEQLANQAAPGGNAQAPKQELTVALKPTHTSHTTVPSAQRKTASPATSQPAPSQPASAQGVTPRANAVVAEGRAPRVAVGKLALPATLDTSLQLPRMRYLCKLLRRTRRPRCGLNGIVTLFPFELSNVGTLQLSALAQSARGDVEAIQETLRVRSPLTAVLIGLEQDKGFNELVRRLPSELLSRRLGGRFDLRSRPTPDELNSHSDRLCDAFEDWVYRLFGREDALAQQRGNRKLYELISRIRHELKPRLRIVLGEAFGCETRAGSEADKDDASFYFSGCYFAASGATTGQPAFVQGVLKDKLEDEQSQVEWTDAALQIHAYFRALAIVGWVVAIILAGLLLVGVIGHT